MFPNLGKRHRSHAVNRTNVGFTLIEVLIVVGITSILAGMVMTYSSRGRTQVALYVEAAKLSQTILRAKSLAVATFNDPNVPCGYGVHVDYVAGSYSLFSYGPPDCSPTGSPTAIGTNPINTDPTTNYYKVISANQLAPGVIYGAGSNNPKMTDILFVPPDPVALIWSEGDVGASNFASNINLVSAADLQSGITVRISSAGQITF